MAKVVEVPGLGNVEFPDDMSDDAIGAALSSHAKPSAAPKAPGLLSRAAKAVGDVGASAAAGAASLGQILDPVVAAAGALGSYAVPYTSGHFFDTSGRELGPQATVGERWKGEMEGLRSRREERARANPNAFGAGAILEGAGIGPALLKLSPFSAGAPTGAGVAPLLTRAGAGVADAALLSGASAAASNLDRAPLAAAGEAMASPANLLGAAPALAGPAYEAAQAAKPAVGRLLAAPLPKVKPTAAALRLRGEGVPLTLGQNDPDSFYAALEQASADHPLGMHLEQKAARDAFGNVIVDKATPPGAEPPAAGPTQERLAAQRAAFDQAYAPLKANAVRPETLTGMAQEALRPRLGVDARTRATAAKEIENALTILDRPPPEGAQGSGLLADPLATASKVQAVAAPEGLKAQSVKIPEWLSPEDYQANREAWDWTWAATGGPEAPKATQRLVYEHMRKAVPGAEDFSFGENGPGLDTHELKRGYAAAKLAQGYGGQKWSGLRDRLAEWAASPEESRAADPITTMYQGTGRDPWGQLVNTTRQETVYGKGNKYGDPQKVDRMSRWILETQAALSPEHPAHLRLPEWYGAAAPEAAAATPAAAPEPAPPPVNVGDLIKVRSNLRDARRSALAQGDMDKVHALEHGISTVTGAIESNLPPEGVAQLRNVDRQYRTFMTVEDAAARGGPESDISARHLAAVLPRTEGKTAVVEGRAGELQDLAQAGARTFDQRVKPTGMRGPLLHMIPKPGMVARLLNEPSIKATLLGEELAPRIAPPVSPVPLSESQARALALAQAMRRYSPTLGVGPIPTTASEDDRR